jgi:tetratricopeptide (TPR) repeat protein
MGCARASVNRPRAIAGFDVIPYARDGIGTHIGRGGTTSGRKAGRAPRAEAAAVPREGPAVRGTLATLALAVMLAIAVVVTHGPVLHAQGLALDDDLFVVRNPLVRSPGWASARRFFTEVTRPSTVSGYYLPLSMTSLMLDWAAGGRPDRLEAFHVTNLALHVAATLLLFALLRALFGSAIPAALVALLWAVHPVMVEPIASAGERKTVLATAFAFATAFAHVRWAGSGARRWWLLSIACFLLAILSKPSALTLPLALLVLDAWPLRRLSRAAVLEKWPHLLLAAAAAAISVLAVRNTWEFGAPPPLDPLRVLAQVVWLQGFYLGKLLRPVGLSTVYDSPARYALTLPSVALPMAFGLSVAAAAVALRRRAPALLTGGLVYFVLLAPTFAILRFGSVIAYDRYLQLPTLGCAIVLASGLSQLWFRAGAQVRTALAVALLALALAAASATRAALRTWRDTMSVWRQAVSVSPGVPDAWNGLGATYSAAGHADEAIAAYRRAIAVGPLYTDAHYNLGRELLLKGRNQEAVPYLEFAEEHSPGNAPSALELGMAYERTQRLAEAEAFYRRALVLRPGFVPALIRLGMVEAARGERDAGVHHVRQALTLSPDDPFAHFALAELLSERSGASPEAVALLRRAIALKPGWSEPLNELAWLLATDPDASRRDPASALALADSALAYAPEASTIDTRAAALAALGRFDEAIAAAGRAQALAHAVGDSSLARDVEVRLAGYRRGHPFVQMPRADH